MPLSKIVAKSIADDTITTDQIADTSVHGRRNLVINGAFQIFQRATSATAATGSYETADRWINFESTDGAYTTEQSTDHPLGSGYSHKAQVTTADTSLGAAQFAYIVQRIEAQNLQHLLYGTSSAKSLTLSFYVKSNKTGTYGINLYKPDSTSYLFVKEYTINSANTWEKKEITISPTAGSTSFITASAGAIANDTGAGLEVGFNLAWGSNFTGGTSDSWSSNTAHYATTNHVNWLDSTSNNFYLAEVQLEVGEQATPFEHRSYADELRRCQRYYAVKGNTEGSSKYFGQTLQVWSTTSVYGILAQYPATMRAVPTVSQSGSFGAYTATSGAGNFNTSIQNFFGTSEGWGTGGWTGSSLVVGDASVMFAGDGAELRADAEL